MFFGPSSTSLGLREQTWIALCLCSFQGFPPVQLRKRRPWQRLRDLLFASPAFLAKGECSNPNLTGMARLLRALKGNAPVASSWVDLQAPAFPVYAHLPLSIVSYLLDTAVPCDVSSLTQLRWTTYQCPSLRARKGCRSCVAYQHSQNLRRHRYFSHNFSLLVHEMESVT